MDGLPVVNIDTGPGGRRILPLLRARLKSEGEDSFALRARTTDKALGFAYCSVSNGDRRRRMSMLRCRVLGDQTPVPHSCQKVWKASYEEDEGRRK